MSAPSPISICNRALTLVGANTIISFLDGTVEAKLCNIHYEQVRNSVTEAYNWSHTRVRFGPLTPEPEAPPFGFSFSYLLPVDLLALRWAGQDPDGVVQLPRYSVEGDKLLCDEESGVYILYSRIVEDTTKFTSLFTEALVARLAAEMAVPLAESRSLAQQLYQLYMAKVDEAVAVDGQQGRNVPTTAVNHQRARWGNGGIAGWLPPGFYNVAAGG